MTTLDARTIIKHEYGDSKNFMTPHVIRMGKIAPHMAYELSWGDAMFLEIHPNGRMYGVSVVKVIKSDWPYETERATELNKSFATEQEAEDYIKYLKDTAPVMARANPLP